MTIARIARHVGARFTIALALLGTVHLATLGTAPASHRAGPPVAVHLASTSHPTIGLPPFWHRTPASWCDEDQPCWIGSDADGRTDAASMRDWVHQLHVGHDR